MTRRAVEIGAGLLPARPARPIAAGERIHVLGAAGAGASAATLLAHHAGALVSGCDPGAPSPYTAALEAAGIALQDEHSANHVTGPEPPDRLAVTKALTSVAPDHAELAAAREAHIPLEPWQQVVADAAAMRPGTRLVAVAGTHGKSTTSGWLVDLLVRDGRDPSAFVGALLPSDLTGAQPATSRWGEGDVFVVEADEYAGNFDAYQPDVALLLNAEWDHPDVFADQSAVEDAFATWLRRAATSGRRPVTVANVADAGVRAVVDRLGGAPMELVTVGIGVAADVRGEVELLEGSTWLTVNGRFGPGRYRVGLPGAHNAANALVVIAAAKVLGAGRAGLTSIEQFRGVGRRLELKGEPGGVTIIDDYGHHPTAIARTLEAVRERYAGRRLWAVYEPLTYHRTASMLEQFADALASGADRVVIADVWAGRDPDTTLTSSAALAVAVSRRGRGKASASGSVEATADYLASQVEPGDVVLVMGGGRSYVIADRLLELLGGAPR